MFVHRLWTLAFPFLVEISKASQLENIKSLLDIEDNVLPNLNISQNNSNAVQILGVWTPYLFTSTQANKISLKK